MISRICNRDEKYPNSIKVLDDMPPKLNCIGNLDLLNSPSVAVVGSRKCTSYGLLVAEKIGELLGRNGITVVSGMAKGIDSAAHRGALKTGGNTIAVLGTGVDVCYPKINKALYDDISQKGLVISEYEDGFSGKPYSFSRRNRIISGLSSSVVIVEAPSRSGALITAEHGISQGKEVYCVPGQITSFFSFGTNALLRDGAKPLVLLDDLVRDLGIIPHCDDEISGLSEKERKVYNIIKTSGEISLEEISVRAKMTSGEAVGLTTVLEMKGIVRLSLGKFFVEKL